LRRARSIAALRDLASALGPLVDDTEWYLFGSIERDEAGAADIDLLVLCPSDERADRLRAAIAENVLGIPLDLSLMTFDEEREVRAIALQRAIRIVPATT
jgi:predicted nucleotidyltransferase